MRKSRRLPVSTCSSVGPFRESIESSPADGAARGVRAQVPSIERVYTSRFPLAFQSRLTMAPDKKSRQQSGFLVVFV